MTTIFYAFSTTLYYYYFLNNYDYYYYAIRYSLRVCAKIYLYIIRIFPNENVFVTVNAAVSLSRARSDLNIIRETDAQSITTPWVRGSRRSAKLKKKEKKRERGKNRKYNTSVLLYYKTGSKVRGCRAGDTRSYFTVACTLRVTSKREEYYNTALEFIIF